MRPFELKCIWTVVVFCAFVLGIGCERVEVAEPQVLKIGVIASLSGPERVGAAETVACARAFAEYYNERGGMLVGKKRYPIELLVRDDEGKPLLAVEIASEFVRAGDVHYVIGLQGDAICMAAAPVLDSAGITYLYDGVLPNVSKENSKGILAEPQAMELFVVFGEYLQLSEELFSVGVLMGTGPSATSQKLLIEELVEEAGMEPVRFARFDVTEEVFDPMDEPEALTSKARRLMAQGADAVILHGQPQGTLALSVAYLRKSGFDGLVVAREPLDRNDFDQVRALGSRVILLGTSMPLDERSEYYRDLKGRYLDQGFMWSGYVDLKFYALEGLLRGVAQCGEAALVSSQPFLDSLATLKFVDPFLAGDRVIGYVPSLSGVCQLSVPILITEYSGGKAQVVYRAYHSE